MLYGQTNSGLLYLVEPSGGKAEKVILPPPSLLPMRLASLKTTQGADGNRVWVEVVTEDGDSGGKRSLPGFVLDGSLQARNFDMGSDALHDWRQFLLGTLGRGGNGLYMMDVSDHKNPKFMWYREKYGNQIVSMDKSSSFNAPVWTDSRGLSGNEAAWLKLGYAGASPAMGVAMNGGDSGNSLTRNIIVVPGGLQTEVDISKNGGEGAVILILDPKDGRVIKAFDGDALANGWRVGDRTVGRTPYMGMILSAPTLLSSSNSSSKYAQFISGHAYAADNRGNIFAISMEGKNGSPIPVQNWSVRTAATLQMKDARGAGTDRNFAIPHGVAFKKEKDGTVWMVGGTANVEVKERGKIINGDGRTVQMLFSINTPLHPAPGDGTIYRDDLHPLQTRANDVMPPGRKGWYIALDTVASTQQKIAGNEYVTTRPTVRGKKMYAATFTLSNIDLSGVEDICNASKSGVNGYSRLYAMDVSNGSNTWNGKDDSKIRFIQIEGVKITGTTPLRNADGSSTLVFTYELLSKDPFANADFKELARKNGITRLSDNSLALYIEKGKDWQAIPPERTIIYYWITK
jgi:hypothetical protein